MISTKDRTPADRSSQRPLCPAEKKFVLTALAILLLVALATYFQG